MVEWRPVVGYEYSYEVSEEGEIRRSNSGLSPNSKIGRVLKPRRDQGYLVVNLHRGFGYQVKTKIHMVVAMAFIGPLEYGKEINHIDGNKENNRRTNLEYVTKGQNVRHSVLQLGSRRKLSQADVVELRMLRSEGMGLSNLSKKFGVDPSTLNKILRGDAMYGREF